MSREEILKNVPIFSELGRRDLDRLAKLMVPRTIAAGDVIVKEKDQAAGFFIILSGKVEVVRGVDSGNPQLLNALGPNEFFGEMALFEGFPRSATVRAVEDTECLAMTRWDFLAELKNHPEIAVSMLPVLVRRLRTVEAHLAE
jgi:CRP/FNR family cyclic AMP-dependent transcriptional regulator